MGTTRLAGRVFVASILAVRLMLPNPQSAAGAQYNPTGYGRMNSWMSGGILDDNSPFMWAGARMNRAYQSAAQLEHVRALEAKAEAEAYQGMLDGTYTPVVRYTDGTANVAHLLAAKIVKAGYKHMSEPEAEAFLTAREADYEHDVAAANLPARSLTSACAYWVDSLYLVGAGAQSSPADREQIRATCALTIGKSEKIGELTNNDQRFALAQALAMIGATFRNLANGRAERSDAIAGARAMFRSQFGYAIDTVPVSRFPCVLSENKLTDCDTIMTRYGAKLPEIARRNT